jgi:hypothetical protein
MLGLEVFEQSNTGIQRQRNYRGKEVIEGKESEDHFFLAKMAFFLRIKSL